MTNFKRLSVGIAAIAACLASANVANATTLAATYTLQTFASMAPYTVKFTFDATTPSYLVYNEYFGGVSPADYIATYTSGPYSGIGSFTVPAAFSGKVSLTYGLVPSVPETATWAMMLVGMGAIGVAVRRRQNVRITYA